MSRAWRMGLLVSLALVAPAQAQSGLKLLTKIDIPGKPLTGFDVSYVDQNTHRYYLADRANAAVDIFDTKSNKFVGRVEGLVGDKKGDVGGPNSELTVGGQLWIMDGDSKVKIADLKTRKIIEEISTGGKKRADESAYDSKDHIVIATNGDDKPGFVTFISTKKGHKVLGKIIFEHASDGIEQPVYDPVSGYFYIDLPELDGNKTLGAVVQVDPKTLKVVKQMEIKDCRPQGLDLAPKGNLFVGCRLVPKSPPPADGILNPKTGAFTRIPGDSGGDEVAYNAAAGQFYHATNHMTGGPVLGVIDAKTNKWLENIPQWGNAHSVATEESSKHVFVPIRPDPGVCDTGCIRVYGPK